MSETRWTPVQERAITIRGCNVLVSAAAGAGKTSVLVERLVRAITDPVDLQLERLLAVTFTEKAAAEMKQRIRASLRSASLASPGDARLERQLLVLDRAQISTIHSFCLSIARRYFYKVGLDPRFRVLDQNESELLRQDALDDIFETLYDDAGERGEAFRVVDRYGEVPMRAPGHDPSPAQFAVSGVYGAWFSDAEREPLRRCGRRGYLEIGLDEMHHPKGLHGPPKGRLLH